ncbi:hypothetical protein PROFUN_02524 [Planoprotostelium fungivorum]|uniref:Uncharacterized protein n=1 Tax=Planoprotostelium fungivorum TaxID=1890364 RepID=A0A2P6MPB1_9EUKA|nr:hypothetical protein PROFUN_02524 [Planoprotostelium fungivorum]
MPKFQDLSGMDLRLSGIMEKPRLGLNSSVLADAQPPDRSSSSSAPPALQQNLLSSNSLFAFHVEYAKLFGDIRAHQDYQNFYESYNGRPAQQKLPPPLEALPFGFDTSWDGFNIRTSYDNFNPGYQPQHSQSYESVDPSQYYNDSRQMGYGRSHNVTIPPPGRPAPLGTGRQQWQGNIAAPTARRPNFDYQDSQMRNYGEIGNSYTESPTAQTASNQMRRAFNSDNYNGYQGNAPTYGNQLKSDHKPPPGFPQRSPSTVRHNNFEEIPAEEQATDNDSENPAGKTPCRYYASGFCSRGDKCFYSHDVPQKSKEKGARGKGGKNSRAQNAPPAQKTTPKGRDNNRDSREREPPVQAPSPNSSSPAFNNRDSRDVMSTIPTNAEGDIEDFETVIGKILAISRDQQGCRYLQKKLEEKEAPVIQKIFEEVSDHVGELMIDPFGNYLCQKLLEFCTSKQRLEIIEKVSGELVSISKNMHGTRAVQKLIECLDTPPQVLLVEKSLKSHVVDLIQDLNGNHVIQRCLNLLKPAENQFIYNSVVTGSNCVRVATHRHGCCVLQRCIDYASPEQKTTLINCITRNALVLVQDPYGNYVVQYVLKQYPDLVDQLAKSFSGHLRQLATQKFSSNVIEKCLQSHSPIAQKMIIDEILIDTGLSIMLQDPFANYVVQTALTVADSKQHAQLVEAIKPHLNSLGNTPYGKRIQSKIMKESGNTRKGQAQHH